MQCTRSYTAPPRLLCMTCAVPKSKLSETPHGVAGDGRLVPFELVANFVCAFSRACHLARRERDQRAEKLEELVASLRQQLEDEKMNVRVCLGRLRTLHSQSRAAAKDSAEVYSAAIKLQLGALKRLCAT